jgi:adenylate kinase
MNIVLLGAPGAGKGTQASRIVEQFDLAHISTGDLLRAAVSAGTELGVKAKGFMDAGELVPDSLVIDLIKDRLRQPDAAAGVIFDGFPRTTAQAEALDSELAAINQKVDCTVAIIVDGDVIVSRLSDRRCCRDCGYIGTSADPVCPKCSGEMYQRDDDMPQTIYNRLEVYDNQTAPLIDYYRRASVLQEVDGDKTPDQVFTQIQQILL